MKQVALILCVVITMLTVTGREELLKEGRGK